jgi:L-alanine-DL-glutamate epimerase-like enolase superfamily enzyme
MRIVDIRETAVPLKSSLANSSFDFSEMTTSVVAVITDVVRDGKPVVGFAFNSTGRYACGAQMRARFIPRVLAAKPDSLLDEAGSNLNPEKILAAMMQREKSGGHSERSVGIGTIEVAVWDAVAKIAGKPLHRVLAERYNKGEVADKVFCYVGGGWYLPNQTFADVQDEMRRHLDAGYTMVKMKVGGLPLMQDSKRVEAVMEVVGTGEKLAVDANSKFQRDEALAYAKALAPLKLRWFEEPCDRSISRCLRRSLPCTRRRSRPARICSPRRTSRTSRVSAGCVTTATSSRSIRRRPMASCNTRERSRCWSITAGNARRCFRTAAIRCRCISPAASGSAGPSPTQTCSAPSAVLRTTRCLRMAI